MPKKKYRLETVFRIRERAKDEAAREIAERYEQLALAEEELGRRQLTLQACYEKQSLAQAAMLEQLSGMSQAKSIVSHQIYLKDLKELENALQKAVDDQKQAVEQAENQVELAREKLMEKARDLKAIEIHKENWVKTEKIEEGRREQKLSDEIGAILYEKNRNPLK